MTGTLYVVATPIGNLEDITLRALRILKEVDLIAAEDTRHTRKLLSFYDIHTPLTSCFAQNEIRKSAQIIGKVKDGLKVALVTDAGAPGLSDPGYRLLRLAWEEGVPVVPIPGASAVTAALSIAGMSAQEFVFAGYLPPKTGQRRKRLEFLAQEGRTVVLFETPHRLLAALADMQQILGDRRMLLAREITKKFEELLYGPAAEIREKLGTRSIRGEITIVLEGGSK